MSVRPRRRALVSAVIAAAILAGGFPSRISTASAIDSSAQEVITELGTASNGPSSSASPYIIPVGAQVSTTAILTVGDSVNNKPDGVTPYRLVGIPDGVGAYDNGDNTFTLLMNHELGPVVGVVRAHGAIGSFVSKWTIRKSDFTVIKGEDLIQNVATWNTSTGAFNAPAKGVVMGRLCSGDLPKLAAFFNSATGNGFNGRIYMNGEEVGNEGRAFGHLLDGNSFELPRLGKFSWENSVANPATGDKTVVVGTDDTTPGQVYVYVGTKANAGNAVARAGLTNGQLYGVKVGGVASEDRTSGIASGTRFTLHVKETLRGGLIQPAPQHFYVLIAACKWCSRERGHPCPPTRRTARLFASGASIRKRRVYSSRSRAQGGQGCPRSRLRLVTLICKTL